MSAFDELMELRPLSPPDNDELEITGSDPVLETKFRLAETASAALASVGVAVNDLWELKTGQRQSIAIDARAATAALCAPPTRADPCPGLGVGRESSRAPARSFPSRAP